MTDRAGEEGTKDRMTSRWLGCWVTGGRKSWRLARAQR